MIFKTRASLAEKVRAAVKAGHPDYVRWIFAETEEAANSE